MLSYDHPTIIFNAYFCSKLRDNVLCAISKQTEIFDIIKQLKE